MGRIFYCISLQTVPKSRGNNGNILRKSFPVACLILGCYFVVGRRHAAEFPKDPVKLGEAGKAGLFGDLSDLIAGVQQKILGILDPGKLNILDNRVAGNLLKAVGKVIRADVKGVRNGG